MQVAPRRFRILLGGRNLYALRQADPRSQLPQDHLPLLNARLTAREAEVIAWIACGKTNPEVAILLSMSERTVRAHLESVRQKLNANTKAHAVALAVRNRLVPF